ncbi:hypothetical protein HK098_005549 [Nowakowskiella sp. JEL0407]|nr:hypothetical protein HK098_005549 [Nowakowskiella sp. JEL0407]
MTTHHPNLKEKPDNNIELLSPDDTNFQRNLLRDVDMSRFSQPYDTLSHVWKDQIKLGETGVKIAHERIAAIDRVAAFSKRYLWVDCLAITQSDITFKSAQVELMHLIYTRANTVHVLLCESSDESMYLLWLAASGLRPRMQDVDVTNFEEPTAAQVESALKSIMSGDEYFTRLWTYQELALARRIMWWNSTATVYLSVEDIIELLYLVECDPDRHLRPLGNVIVPWLAAFFVPNSDEFEQNKSPAFDKMINENKKHKNMGMRECERMIDYVYATVRMFDMKVKVDYGIDMSEQLKLIDFYFKVLYVRGYNAMLMDVRDTKCWFPKVIGESVEEEYRKACKSLPAHNMRLSTPARQLDWKDRISLALLSATQKSDSILFLTEVRDCDLVLDGFIDLDGSIRAVASREFLDKVQMESEYYLNVGYAVWASNAIRERVLHNSPSVRLAKYKCTGGAYLVSGREHSPSQKVELIRRGNIISLVGCSGTLGRLQRRHIGDVIAFEHDISTWRIAFRIVS